MSSKYVTCDVDYLFIIYSSLVSNVQPRYLEPACDYYTKLPVKRVGGNFSIVIFQNVTRFDVF